MLTILKDQHTINIVTNVLVIFAGLYTYQGLLGRPGGLLRQLLVGVPLGVAYGVGNYYFDVAANHILSNVFKELVQSPAIPISSVTIGIIGFVGGLTFPLLSPNFFRIKSEDRQKLTIPTIVLLFVVSIASGTFWDAIGILTLFHLLSGWLHFYPPLFAVLALAFVLATIACFYTNSQLRLLNPTADTTSATPQPTVLGCIVNLIVLVPVISLWIYFIVAAGWTALGFFGIFLLIGALISLLQYGTDRLTEQGLLEVSLVLFLMAAVLQLYQAIV